MSDSKSYLDVLRVYHVDTNKKIRLGVQNDGGYVIVNLEDGDGGGGGGGGGDGDGGDNCLYDCYISAGVSNEESFTRDFLARYSRSCLFNETNCFAFDGTIQAYPTQYTDKITFFKKNIGGGVGPGEGVDTDSETNLRFLLNKYSRVFLKMDIEGGEYPWLMRMGEDDLRKIRQIVIEFHGITGAGWGAEFHQKWACMKKLSETHFIVHAHGNNYSHSASGMPDVIELTCIERSYFLKTFGAGDGAPVLNRVPMPISGLDFPNNVGRGDYDLNFYPFVAKE
jgi:hypothetical protein